VHASPTFRHFPLHAPPVHTPPLRTSPLPPPTGSAVRLLVTPSTSTLDSELTTVSVPGETSPAPLPVHEEQLDLAERVTADGTEFLLALFVDLAGRQNAKLIPAKAVERFQQRGTDFAGQAVGVLALGNSDPDLTAMPDPSTYTPLPAVRPGLALVHCDPYVGGRPWPYAPRVILREAVRRAAETGLDLQVGAEVEYYLLKRDESGALRPADPLDDAPRPAYNPQAATRMYDHIAAVSATMDELGWGNYANEHEDGNGQYEQNFEHADALTTADRIITLRYVIEALAERAGMIATFMPKPFGERIGNGMHLHLSLWRDGQPTFPDPEDPRGLGLSPLAYSFIGGIIEHAQALQAVIAPTVNSYKRHSFLTTATAGVNWAPRLATYGGNDRNLYVRVPAGDRVELRAVDGLANPYLAMAAVLGAGLDGVSRDVDPGTPDAFNSTGQLVSNAEEPTPRRPMLPPTLLHAVEALAVDPTVCAALDVAGAPVSKYFADAKRAEFFVWHTDVSQWEIDRYLTGYC
jgi:glutamine synthetase